MTQLVNRAQQLPNVRPDPPPLRIHHLMACAAVAAVQFSLWRVRHPQMIEYISATGAAMEAIRQSLNAVGLTCVIFSIYWHFKGYAGFTQPGQCLLAGYAFSAMELYLMALLLWTFGPDLNDVGRSMSSGGVLTWIFTIVNLAIYLGLMAFYGWCAWKIADTQPWRLTLASLALEVFVFPLSFVLIHYGYARNTAVVIPALVATCTVMLLEIWSIANDVASRRERFWMHWVGVSLSMTGRVLSIAGISSNFLR